jgi:hypothetical protein
MYQVYLKEQDGFSSKQLIGEYKDIDDAYAKVDKTLEKNKDTKYVIEETDGHVDNYGELIATVVEEN